MNLSLIVAMGDHGVIGDGKGLPWHLPRDLRRFRAITMGKPVIMGRRTFESIDRPLYGRQVIVMTRRLTWLPPGVVVVRSVAEALDAARSYWGVRSTERPETLVAGGGDVYRAFLPVIDRVYLTRVSGSFPGGVTFPSAEFVAIPWEIVYSETSPADARNPHADVFQVYERKKSRRRQGS